MKAMKHSFEFDQGTSDWATRAIVFSVVVSAHLAVFSVWSKQADTKWVTKKELSVSFAIAAQTPQAVSVQPRKQPQDPLPVSLPAQAVEPLPAETEQLPAAVVTPSLAPAAAAETATEPDYKAAYLNNPPPAYPMVARRNGLQGRVVLNVEVLASGVCGQINVHKSSGYTMLDEAALQTVKTWRFLPASQAGRAVDKWFMIPIQFSLKDNKA